MAKKKKVQKKSIQKRQVVKANQRKQTKRKQAARKAPQKQMSMAKVKKNLKALPGLVFEPEMSALNFDVAALKAASEASGLEPEQIDFVADQGEFKRRFKETIETMDARFAKLGDGNKQMMTQAMLYFLGQEESPSCMNQLIVALYLNSIQLTETGDPYSFAALDEALKAYDDTHEAYFEARNAELEQAKTSEGVEGEPEPEAVVSPSAFSRLLGQIESWVSTTELDEDQSERLVDDLTALFDDYAGEKEWETLDEVTPRRVQSFVGWFERNMNPTDEDLALLKGSLLTFFGGPVAQNEFGEQTCGTILATL